MGLNFKKLKKMLNKEKTSDIEFFLHEEEENDKKQQKPKKTKHQKPKKKKHQNLRKLSKEHKTSRNIFRNFRRRNTIQIIKYLETKNILNCFFYTDVQNINLILEHGIRPTNQVKLLSEEEYIVWTYLEHTNFLELELSNSTRHYFWKWCTEQKVELNSIAILSIDINKLFQLTTDDWGLNLETNRIQIYEKIPREAINWILVKDRKFFKLAKLYIENQNLKIQIFQGNDGQIIS